MDTLTGTWNINQNLQLNISEQLCISNHLINLIK